MKKNLKTRARRYGTIFAPLIALFATFVFISPILGFQLFPQGDTPFLFFSVSQKTGTTQEYLAQYADELHDVFSQIPEVQHYNIDITDNRIRVSTELFNKGYRRDRDLRMSPDIETWVLDQLKYLKTQGLRVTSEAISNGPPGTKPVGIKLVANSALKFQNLIDVSSDFELFLLNVPGTKNVGNTSQQTP